MSVALHDSQPRRREILIGNALSRLHDLPGASIDMVVTSPPYFRLRNYRADGQIGLETSVDKWVDNPWLVCHELARVLVPTGSLWLNLGDTYSTHPRQGAARKSVLMGPERLALRLIADGWLVRNKIVWAKTNSMPTSVADRLTCRYEIIYLLVRQPKYYFDLDAIRQPHTSRPPKRKARATRPPDRREAWRGPNGQNEGGLKYLHARGLAGHPLGKNPGDVWPLSSSNYRGAHFATFPEHLVERIIRAGCPEKRCRACRRPWQRSLRRLGDTAIRGALKATCDCSAASEPGLVLDPFMGAGTTALAAENLGRDWLGIDLNPEFVRLAEERLTAARTGPTPGSDEEKPTKRKEVT